MLRGLLICVIGTTPNSGDAGSVVGNPKIGVFDRLYAVTLNWNLCPSLIKKSRFNARSSWGAVWRRMLGLRNGAVRWVLGGRCTQMSLEVSNQWSSVCPLSSLG